VAITIERLEFRAINPFHAVLLAGTIPLFLGAAVADAAYGATYHVAWKNFAAWLNAAALLFAAIAFVAAVVGLFRADRRMGSAAASMLFLLAAWVVGFFNALVHARDAWASMPTALVLSIVATVLVLVATWFGFRMPDVGGTT